jgi:GDPmannose 4,6-dehydratase
MSRTALITGVGGQAGQHLRTLLIEKGYAVIGLARRAEKDDERYTHVHADVRDDAVIARILREHDVDEVYNLAGESFGPRSWERAIESAEVLGVAVAKMLEAIRTSGRPVHFFQASSSELFGDALESPQSEKTPIRPLTPYGAAKEYAYRMVEMYRRRYGVFACSGILFNYESPLRRPEFVTRKVTSTVAKIRAGLATELRLGNLDVRRDWGYAGDVADAMWRMLQQDEPDDFVIATGIPHTIRELCEIAFERVGLDYRKYVVEDAALHRTEEFDRCGDPAKARTRLGWEPRVNFRKMIEMMVDADLQSVREERG